MNLRRPKKPLSLQVTSLLDMFTIILVFLMVSFEADAVEAEQTPGVQLPASDARVPLSHAPEVAVTVDAVLVEGARVSALDPIDQAAIIAALQAQPAAAEGDLAGEAVVIKADQDTDYPTLHQVLEAAALAGRTKHRLLIERE